MLDPVYSKEVKSLSWRDIGMPMFTAALFVVAKIWKQPKCPSTNEWINKMGYIYIHGILFSLKKEGNSVVYKNMAFMLLPQGHVLAGFFPEMLFPQHSSFKSGLLRSLVKCHSIETRSRDIPSKQPPSPSIPCFPRLQSVLSCYFLLLFAWLSVSPPLGRCCIDAGVLFVRCRTPVQ